MPTVRPFDPRPCAPSPVTLVALAVAVVFAAPAAGQLWIDASDARARRDVELLAAYGRIGGPVTSWPLAWAQVRGGLAVPAADGLPPHVVRAEERLRARAERAAATDPRLTARVALQNEPLLVRGFGEAAREDTDLRVSVHDRLGSSVYLGGSVGWRDGQRGDDVTFDDSYVAVDLGNWGLHAGTIGEWWGGGWDGALVLSTNGRAYPRIGLQRLTPRVLDVPVLRWLGPWSLTVAAGRLEDDRAVPHPFTLHTRLVIQPAEGLDIGFSRTLQICGEGRACGLEQWARGVVGIGDLDNTGDRDVDPGNQLGAVDVRFGNVWGEVGYAFYAEMMGEDTGEFPLEKASILVGTTWDGFWSGAGVAWRLRLEAADTRAERAFGLFTAQPGVTYNHFIYRDGWSFQGRTIGHGLDTDSRLLTGEAHVTDAGERGYRLTYRHAVVNDSDGLRHKVSAAREAIHSVELEFTTPLPHGDARLGVLVQSDQPDTPGRADGSVRFELGWTVRAGS